MPVTLAYVELSENIYNIYNTYIALMIVLAFKPLQRGTVGAGFCRHSLEAFL